MSHPDAERWNRKYTADAPKWLNHQPRQLLLDYAHLLPEQGVALDAAAGVATHGLFLAARGLHVIALDISEVGLRLARQQAREKGVWLETAVIDLSIPWFPAHVFDVIVNFRFLERATFPMYRRALKPGGWLIFETFVKSGSDVPHPEYFLNPSELGAAFYDFKQVHYAQTAVPGGRSCKTRMVEQLVAQKRSVTYIDKVGR